MASPPYRSPAASPPNPAHAALPNPRKRPPIGAAPGVPSAFKRRKPSSFSTASSNHPLRQTSFPPEESRGQLQRSPSVDSDDLSVITGNQSAAPSTAGGPKKRGRKKKNATGPDAASVRSSGRDKAGPSDAASRAGDGADDADGEEDDDADGGDDDMVESGAAVDQLAEKKKIAVLLDAFNVDQSERYNSFRRARFKKETVRKITNQTLSQSVPPSVVTTINGLTKVFIGTLIERARDVQKENALARGASSRPTSSGQGTQESSRTLVDGSQGMMPMGQDGGAVEQDDLRYLGPLLPDDIREAFRRQRRNGEGGGAGTSGLSVNLGVPGSAAARMREKRMFR